MSMYNLIYGYDPMAPVLLSILQLHPLNVPRFRDCWWNGEHIVVYTRTGGGNRPFYESAESCRKNYGDDSCTGPWNEDLRKLSTYVYDKDCDLDSTYAEFYFDLPEKFKWAIPQFIVQDKTPTQRFEQFMAKMRDPAHAEDQDVKRTIGAMKELLQEIAKVFEENSR